MKPTTKQYGAFEKMFDYLNRTLFDSSLPDCMLSFTRRSTKTDGYFIPASWSEDGMDLKHEISINPQMLENQNKEDILAIICHNMVHLSQFIASGTADEERNNYSGYHNLEWAEKMESIGLIPSNTGQTGGEKTGYAVSQYPQPGGLFEKICVSMPDSFLLPFRAAGKSQRERHKKVKTSYVCPVCRAKFWGKQGLGAICNRCGNRSFGKELFKIIDDIAGETADARRQVAELIEKYRLVAVEKAC